MLKEKKSRKKPNVILSYEEINKNNNDWLVKEEIKKQIEEDGIVEYQNYLFQNWDFSEFSLENCQFDNCIFKNCDFSNQKMENAAFLEVEFVGCKFMGASFSNALFRNVLFDECDMHYVTLFSVKMIVVEYNKTSLEKSYLADSSLQNCIFNDTNFLESDILHTSFSDIDISSCCFKDVRVTLDSIKGAIVSEEQALAFSKLLGIKIKEE